MYRSSYNTMVTRNYRRDKLQRQLEEAIVKNELPRSFINPNTKLFLLTPDVKEVDAFAHPMSVTLSTRDDETVFAVDTRPFLKGTKDNYGIKDTMDYEALIGRALLEISMFEDGNARELYLAGDAPMWVFVNWLANRIAANIGLDPASQIELQIIFALHYVGMHGFIGDELSDSERGRVATRIGRVLRLPVDKVLEIWGEWMMTGSLAQTVNLAHERISSSRIKLLTPAMILQLATGTSGWRGAHSREVVGIALEHAPTWHFMVFAASFSSAYKRSTLADLLYKQYKDKGGLKSYTKSISLLVQGTR